MTAIEFVVARGIYSPIPAQIAADFSDILRSCRLLVDGLRVSELAEEDGGVRWSSSVIELTTPVARLCLGWADAVAVGRSDGDVQDVDFDTNVLLYTFNRTPESVFLTAVLAFATSGQLKASGVAPRWFSLSSQLFWDRAELEHRIRRSLAGSLDETSRNFVRGLGGEWPEWEAGIR